MRPTRDQWAMSLALETAKRTTCIRRGVGAVLVSKRGYVLATGYNGVASGQVHCNHVVKVLPGFASKVVKEYPHACPGAFSPSGTNLDGCHAIHAEQNALLQCKDIHDIETCYTTTSPCMTCCKLLLNTSCIRIVFTEPYVNQDAKALWESSGREWVHFQQ